MKLLCKKIKSRTCLEIFQSTNDTTTIAVPAESHTHYIYCYLEPFPSLSLFIWQKRKILKGITIYTSIPMNKALVREIDAMVENHLDALEKRRKMRKQVLTSYGPNFTSLCIH